MKNVIFLLLLLPAVATAQVDISTQVGYSMAVGDYGSSNNNNSNALYAQSGAELALWGGVRVTDFMGVNVAFAGSSQAVNSTQFASAIGAPPSQLGMDDYYTTAAFMGGVYFFFGDQVQITTRLAAGIGGFNDADYTVTGQGGRLNVYHYPEGSIAWTIQPEVNFPITHWFSISAYGNYYRSHHGIAYDMHVNGSLQDSDYYETTVQNINIGISLAFHIGNSEK